MRRLYREEYADFTAKHFHEELRKRHNYTLGYTVTRLALQSAGLVAKAKRRGQHRKKRPRRPLPGMLLFQDGSTHRWIVALDHDLDLVVTLDDATGVIYSAVLVAQEGTMSSFLGLCETIGAHGLFGALYTDRGSHYFLTPKAGARLPRRRRRRSVRRRHGSASVTSPRIRRKGAGGWSGCSARCSSVCRRSCAGLG